MNTVEYESQQSNSYTMGLQQPHSTPILRTSPSSQRSDCGADANSFEALIEDRDQFLIDLAAFMAKMRQQSKRRLCEHRAASMKRHESSPIVDIAYSAHSPPSSPPAAASAVSWHGDIFTDDTQVVHFLTDWCIVYTKYLNRAATPRMTMIAPHMRDIAQFIFAHFAPIDLDRFIHEKCYFSNMIQTYVKRDMQRSASDIGQVVHECMVELHLEMVDLFDWRHIADIIAEYMVHDFECNIGDDMVVRVSSARNHSTAYSLSNLFDDSGKRFYRTGDRGYLLLLVRLSTKYHSHCQQQQSKFVFTDDDDDDDGHGDDEVDGLCADIDTQTLFVAVGAIEYQVSLALPAAAEKFVFTDADGDGDGDGDDEVDGLCADIDTQTHDAYADDKVSYFERDRKGFLITNIEVRAPAIDYAIVDHEHNERQHAVDKCMVWIFKEERTAFAKYDELMQSQLSTETYTHGGDDDDEWESFAIHDDKDGNGDDEVVIESVSGIRDENQYVVKKTGLCAMDAHKMSQPMSVKGRFVLFALQPSREHDTLMSNIEDHDQCVDVANISITMARL
eukprot:CAMPEP_0202729234 /NCGR_PEP_ID=MMETSP1385-20130828/186028_1 /ASSEMBLY_ACC=CAM_ASM_000861 /TAXON_ID=933848 /ORGANISM="Elphidium margaritaceum" /LENGTH=560 /DNA_ID=CAMNT_0049395491 /DNA_START=116 /DNA_END=1799 /DNA_ORIENTATION=-